VLGLDPARVSRGREIYLEACARCHGPHAEDAPRWRQPDARGDLPAPSHDDSGHTWRHSDAQLADVIRNGMRDPFNKTPELTMPPFKGQLTDAQIADVIVYFKSLWSDEHRAYQEEQNHRAPMPQPRRMP
jgi:mono/diheme cytochrome c family protein